jgi:hypothetical protein
MATYESRDRHRRWREYVLPNPTLAAELCKAQAAIDHEMRRLGLDTSYDNAYEVLATEEEIILRFEIEVGVEHPRYT